jgi:hypothetical protein
LDDHELFGCVATLLMYVEREAEAVESAVVEPRGEDG